LHDLLTVFLDPSVGKGGILNVVNDTGGPSTIAHPDVPVTGVSYPGCDTSCPLLAGSPPAKVRKSVIRKPAPAEVRVGVQRGCCTRYEPGSLSMRPTSTSATIRPPTGPSVNPPAFTSPSLST